MSADERSLAWHQSAWTELAGYVEEACADGGVIEPDAMRAYMAELKHRYQLPPTQENLMEALRGAATWTGYPHSFAWGTQCTGSNEWCNYGEPHEHGFPCEPECPCRADAGRWRAA